MLKVRDKIGEFECIGIRKVIWDDELEMLVDAKSNATKYDYQIKFSITHPKFGKLICLNTISKEFVEDIQYEEQMNYILNKYLTAGYEYQIQKRENNPCYGCETHGGEECIRCQHAKKE